MSLKYNKLLQDAIWIGEDSFFVCSGGHFVGQQDGRQKRFAPAILGCDTNHLTRKVIVVSIRNFAIRLVITICEGYLTTSQLNFIS